MTDPIEQELARARVHLDAIAQLVSELPHSPLLLQFCERIDALVDEFSYELGIVDK